jgi:hypothetical protein
MRVMIVTKKFLPRRTILRGMGTALALPLLDSMVPAFGGVRARAASEPVKRFGAVFVPMGASQSLSQGVNYWEPKGEGALELSPILSPLARVKDRALVITGLGCHAADIVDGGPHPRLQTAWLTGTKCKATEGVDIEAGVSLDQIVAREFGRATQLDSLQVGIENNETIGTCAAQYSCTYGNTISWRTATSPLPMENNPRAVFERLFGASESTDSAARLAAVHQQRSILDFVNDELSRFERRIGPVDRQKVDQYLESVRDIERRLQKAEEQSRQDVGVVEQPAGVPATYKEHVELMFDLLVIAYQADLSRVFSFLMAREASTRAYPEVGVSESHHPLSHHGNNPDAMAKLAKINTFHMQLFTYLVEKLAATPDGEGTLLDRTVLLYGSGMGDPNLHNPLNVPSLIISGSQMGIKTGVHVKYPLTAKLTSLQLALLEKLGMRMDHFGDATDALSL